MSWPPQYILLLSLGVFQMSLGALADLDVSGAQEALGKSNLSMPVIGMSIGALAKHALLPKAL